MAVLPPQFYPSNVNLAIIAADLSTRDMLKTADSATYFVGELPLSIVFLLFFLVPLYSKAEQM